jgi:hypothetical protein
MNTWNAEAEKDIAKFKFTVTALIIQGTFVEDPFLGEEATMVQAWLDAHTDLLEDAAETVRDFIDGLVPPWLEPVTETHIAQHSHPRALTCFPACTAFETVAPIEMWRD